MAMTPSPSPLQRVGPTCREWKGKRLQVGCNPSAINSTHTPVWLLNEWKLVSCLPLCWAPGPRVSTRLLTGAAHVLDATFKMAPWNCKRPPLRRERRTHTALICFDKLHHHPSSPPLRRYLLPACASPRSLCSVKWRAIHTRVTGPRYRSWQSQ